MNKIDLNERKAIITGGARGIGYAIAERLLDSGASCSLWDRDSARLAEAGKKLSPANNVHTVTVDITRAESAEEAAEATFKHFGGIDILVNNAGIAGVTKPTWEMTPAEWREVIEVNLLGQRVQSRCDGVNQIIGQRTGQNRHPGQLHHARSHPDRNPRQRSAKSHRVHAISDTDGPVRAQGRSRRHGRLALLGGLLVQHRRGV